MRKSPYPFNVDTIGKAIRKRRMDYSISLCALGEKVGKSGSYLWRIEAGRRDAPLRTLKSICRSLKLELRISIGNETITL
jgi:transcriptional regulator with XRE-family HTH domain